MLGMKHYQLSLSVIARFMAEIDQIQLTIMRSRPGLRCWMANLSTKSGRVLREVYERGV